MVCPDNNYDVSRLTGRGDTKYKGSYLPIHFAGVLAPRPAGTDVSFCDESGHCSKRLVKQNPTVEAVCQDPVIIFQTSKHTQFMSCFQTIKQNHLVNICCEFMCLESVSKTGFLNESWREIIYLLHQYTIEEDNLHHQHRMEGMYYISFLYFA